MSRQLLTINAAGDYFSNNNEYNYSKTTNISSDNSSQQLRRSLRIEMMNNNDMNSSNNNNNKRSNSISSHHSINKTSSYTNLIDYQPSCESLTRKLQQLSLYGNKQYKRAVGDMLSTCQTDFPLRNKQSIYRHHVEIQASKLIGAGAFGKVFENKSPQNTVTKIIRIKNDKYSQPKQLIEELLIGHYAGLLDVGPKILDYWVCEPGELMVENYENNNNNHLTPSSIYSHLFIIMEKMNGMTLREYQKMFKTDYLKNRNEIHKKIDDQIKKMHSAHIYHRDLYSRNIYLIGGLNETSNSFQIDGIKLFDYGLSEIVDDPKHDERLESDFIFSTSF
jgi:hypothetical protein